jgi:two-component system, chemotaxis family, response regulator Rcp1
MPEILVAEDNPADVYLIREALKEHGVECTVRTAADGKDVMTLLSSGDSTWSPNLIILDLNLPRHDGIEILQKVRATQAIAHVPIVVLTSSDSPRDRATALDSGATRYIRKPSNLEQFLQLGAVFKELSMGPSRDAAAPVSEESIDEA